MDWLVVEQVSKKMGGQSVLHALSFQQKRGEKIGIAGSTGAGKSTLLKIIGGLAQPDSGRVIFDGKRVIGPDEQLIPGHPRIAYLSQHFELRNNYWVHEILAYANTLSDAEAGELYRICDIEHLKNRRTHELSGGEKQRIALARLLTGQPDLLLLDEPFSNLDAIHKTVLQQVLDQLTEVRGLDMILVSHDAQDLLGWANTILVMEAGKIVQMDTPERVYFYPSQTEWAGLFGAFHVPSPALAGALGIDLRETPILRPTQCIISDHPAAIEVTVTHTRFSGLGYELQVSWGQESWWMHTPHKVGATRLRISYASAF
jgi:ABC-type sulfate/molybdate transport systems ATPase subunit